MNIKELREQNVQHTNDVFYLMSRNLHDISKRMYKHDITKHSPEGEAMLLKALNTKDFTEWEEYHFSKEDHHVEFHQAPANMSLEALLEMTADGASAAYRRNKKIQAWPDQFAFYRKKGWDIQMATMLANQFMRNYTALLLRDKDAGKL